MSDYLYLPLRGKTDEDSESKKLKEKLDEILEESPIFKMLTEEEKEQAKDYFIKRYTLNALKGV